uniref:Thyroglobulin type-1 domain-containing protein n=1 Tax=Strigamia maritima TaxID=126957 RepID=T1JL42_STRMM
CTQNDRKNFNDNLVKIFLSEYNRLPVTTTATTKATPLIESKEKRAVEWKFSELDRNGDYELDKKELQTLRRMLKKIVRPKTCARTFTKTCDQNQDRRINRAEWTLCLGVDMNNEQTEHLDKEDSGLSIEKEVPSLWNRQITTLSAHVNPTDTNVKLADEDIGDCLSARQLAADQQHTEGKVFVPECTIEGKYSKLQCFKPTGYCWCVDPESGKTIPGTSIQDDKPDCDKSFRAYKPIKGCHPERKKQQFLNEMLDLIVKEMLANQSAIEQKTDSFKTSQELQEKAALYKYRLQDTNRNQVIDKKEWKEFKNDIKKRKVMKKCGRNFLKYCDDDNNRRVTEEEWISCLGLRGIYVTTI